MNSAKRIKVSTLLGTRPEIIRLSEIIKKFDQKFDHRLIFTSQNREAFVGSNFFSELEVRCPDVTFENKSNSTAEFLSMLFVELEKELLTNKPDAVVILGDTNSSLSSIIVQKLGIPIYHLEAGNRSFDPNVPEETNRKILDHISDFNLAYSKQAKANLIQEGLSSRNSIVIGTPLREVIVNNLKKIDESKAVEQHSLKPGKYFLVSAHRQENIDIPARLSNLIDTLNQIAMRYELPIVVSTHPRLKSM